MLDRFSKRRCKKLTVKLTSSPMLPILGWSKCVESFVVGGELLAWIIYTVIITAIWVFADDISEATDILE